MSRRLTSSRCPVPLSGVAARVDSMSDLKAILHEQLKAQRAALFGKLDGLSERAARMPRTPTGTNLLGLLKHAAAAELG